MRSVFLVVHPYGHVDASRHPVELQGLNQYFDGVIDLIIREQERIRRILVPGGMIKGGIVEADSVAQELRRRLDRAGIEIPVETDPVPKSTVSIVERATKGLKPPETILWMTCDKVRFAKTLYLTWHFRRKAHLKFQYKVIPFRRDDIHPNSTPLRQLAELALIVLLGPERIQRRIERER